MECTICPQGGKQPGKMTVILERVRTAVVIEVVPPICARTEANSALPGNSPRK